MNKKAAFLALGYIDNGGLNHGVDFIGTVPHWGPTLLSAAAEACKDKRVHCFHLAILRADLKDGIKGDAFSAPDLDETIRAFGWTQEEIIRVPGLNFVGSYFAFPTRKYAASMAKTLKQLGLPSADPASLPEFTPNVCIRGNYPTPLLEGNRIFSPKGRFVYGPELPYKRITTFPSLAPGVSA